MLSYFVPEAEEYLDTIDTLAAPYVRMRDDDASHRLFRTAHTLKGSAFTVGFQVIGDIAHPMEDCMVAVRESRVPLSAALCDVMTQATAIIRLLLRRDPAHAERLKRDIPVILRLLKQLSEGASVAVPEKLETINQSEGTATVPSPTPAASPIQAGAGEAPAHLADDYLVPHLDPEVLSYFAPEAQEYLETLEANLLRLDKDPSE